MVHGQRHAPTLLPPERPGTHCVGGWVGPISVWVGAENFAPIGIRSPDRSARSQSLYRLRYPCPIVLKHIHTYIHKYTRTYRHIRTYIHIYICTYVHKYIRTYINKYIRTYIHKHKNTSTRYRFLFSNE